MVRSGGDPRPHHRKICRAAELEVATVKRKGGETKDLNINSNEPVEYQGGRHQCVGGVGQQRRPANLTYDESAANQQDRRQQRQSRGGAVTNLNLTNSEPTHYRRTSESASAKSSQDSQDDTSHHHERANATSTSFRQQTSKHQTDQIQHRVPEEPEPSITPQQPPRVNQIGLINA